MATAMLWKKHIARRAVLRGVGATIALPLLDAMAPAATRWSATAAAASAAAPRLVTMEMVHGAAGCTAFGEKLHLWAPEKVGRGFDLSKGSLRSLSAVQDYLTIVSNTDVKNAEAQSASEVGGDHYRSSAVMYTQAHPRQTQGSNIHAGISLDQIHALRFGQETPIPSLQLSIESVDQAGGCLYGYSCVYTDSISWTSPTTPLPMVRDPRLVFDRLFGAGATPAERAANIRSDRSVLDWMTAQIAQLNAALGAADKGRLELYLDAIREIERRIQRVEARNASGEQRELPGAPIGVPDSFEDHVKIMMDLIALAFQADTTRVVSFKLGRDASGRAYPDSGVNTGFHNASHHGEREERILDFAKINSYHVGMVPYLAERLREMRSGEASLLDQSLIIYGSPMANPNFHSHRRAPLFLLGRAGGRLRGGLHVRAADGTPMANAMLSMLRALGHDDLESFGDNDGVVDLNHDADAAATPGERA